MGAYFARAEWSWGCVAAIDREGRTIWIADAHRDNGKRFVTVPSTNRSTACCNARLTACRRSQRLVPLIERDCALELTQQVGQDPGPHRHKAPTMRAARCSTQRAGIASPHAAGDWLSGVTGDRESNAFISGPTGFVGGVPLTRAMNPWAMPEAST